MKNDFFRLSKPLGISLLLLFTGKIIHFLQTGTYDKDLDSLWFMVSILACLDFLIIKRNYTNQLSGVFLLSFSVYIFANVIIKSLSKDYFEWPYYPEYGLQMLLPLVAFLVYKDSIREKTLYNILLIGTALTFFGHASFAIGLFCDVPDNFIKLVSSFFKVESGQALLLLKIMAIIDYLLVILFFFPNKIRKYAFLYAGFWGITTALARVLAFWGSGDEILSADFGGMVYRMLHGLVPLYLYNISRKNHTFFPAK